MILKINDIYVKIEEIIALCQRQGKIFIILKNGRDLITDDNDTFNDVLISFNESLKPKEAKCP